MRLGRAMLDELDGFAASELDSPGRPEAVRRLLRQAFDERRRQAPDERGEPSEA